MHICNGHSETFSFRSKTCAFHYIVKPVCYNQLNQKVDIVVLKYDEVKKKAHLILKNCQSTSRKRRVNRKNLNFKKYRSTLSLKLLFLVLMSI